MPNGQPPVNGACPSRPASSNLASSPAHVRPGMDENALMASFHDFAVSKNWSTEHLVAATSIYNTIRDEGPAAVLATPSRHRTTKQAWTGRHMGSAVVSATDIGHGPDCTLLPECFRMVAFSMFRISPVASGHARRRHFQKQSPLEVVQPVESYLAQPRRTVSKKAATAADMLGPIEIPRCTSPDMEGWWDALSSSLDNGTCIPTSTLPDRGLGNKSAINADCSSMGDGGNRCARSFRSRRPSRSAHSAYA